MCLPSPTTRSVLSSTFPTRDPTSPLCRSGLLPATTGSSTVESTLTPRSDSDGGGERVHPTDGRKKRSTTQGYGRVGTTHPTQGEVSLILVPSNLVLPRTLIHVFASSRGIINYHPLSFIVVSVGRRSGAGQTDPGSRRRTGDYTDI